MSHAWALGAQRGILPWEVRRDSRSPLYGVFDANGFIVSAGLLRDEAEFVVRAVNDFDMLRQLIADAAALFRVAPVKDDEPWVSQAVEWLRRDGVPGTTSSLMGVKR